MILTAAELGYLRSHGLFIRDECDGCTKVLNQAFSYMVDCRKLAPEVVQRNRANHN